MQVTHQSPIKANPFFAKTDVAQAGKGVAPFKRNSTLNMVSMRPSPMERFLSSNNMAANPVNEDLRAENSCANSSICSSEEELNEEDDDDDQTEGDSLATPSDKCSSNQATTPCFFNAASRGTDKSEELKEV